MCWYSVLKTVQNYRLCPVRRFFFQSFACWLIVSTKVPADSSNPWDNGCTIYNPGKNWSMMRAFCEIWINLTTIWNDGEVSLAEASMEYVEGKATQKYGFSLQMSGNHLQMVIFQLPRNGERNWKLSQRVMTGVALGEVSDVLSDQGFRSRTGSIWRKRTLKHQNSNPNHQPSFFSYKYLYIYTYHYHCHYIYIYIYIPILALEVLFFQNQFLEQIPSLGRQNLHPPSVSGSPGPDRARRCSGIEKLENPTLILGSKQSSVESSGTRDARHLGHRATGYSDKSNWKIISDWELPKVEQPKTNKQNASSEKPAVIPSIIIWPTASSGPSIHNSTPLCDFSPVMTLSKAKIQKAIKTMKRRPNLSTASRIGQKAPLGNVEWYGYDMHMIWIWYGYDMDMIWIWYGYVV